MLGVERPSPPWIGRREVLDALRHRGSVLESGRGGFTLLEGDAGVGKSTLVARIADDMRERGFYVLAGRVPALDNPPPFHLLRSALSGIDEVSSSAPLMGPDVPSALAFVPMGPQPVTGPLGFLGFDSAPGVVDSLTLAERVVEALEAPADTLEANRARLFGRLADQLVRLAQDRPTLLVLQNMDLADALSLEFLQTLAPELERQRLWVLGTTVPMSSVPEGRRPLLERTVRELKPERLVLRPFSAIEVAEFVHFVDPDLSMTPEEVIRWHSLTAGNPQLLEQVVRRRQAGGAPVGDDGGPLATEDVDRWAQELPEAERRVVSMGAVLGHQFEFATLVRALGDAEETTAEVSERLMERGVWRERPGEQLEFVREDVRHRLYGSLTDTRRRILHRRIGEAIESRGPPDVAGVYALARHFYLGHVDPKAVAYNRRAAEFATRSFAPQAAILHIDQALDSQRRISPRDYAAELDMTLELAMQLDRIGELRRSEELLQAAFNDPALKAGADSVQRELLPVYLARILTDQGRWVDADRLTNEVLLRLGPAPSPAVRIAVHRLRGEILFYRGEYDASLKHHEAALLSARETHNDREIALEVVRRANVLGMIPGRVDEAISGYRSASESLLALGDAGEAAYALMSEGVVLSQHGQSAEGLKVLRKAVVLAEKANDQRRVGWSLFNIADLTLEQGGLDEATATNRRARVVLERIGDRFGVAQTHIIEGKIGLARQNPVAAEQALLEAFRLTRELRAEADELEVTLRLAEVAVLRSDFSTAWMRVRELERKQIDRVRPDLKADFEKLRDRLPDLSEGRDATAPG